jgi:acetyl-CoA carboxylase carboxyltransferase component
MMEEQLKKFAQLEAQAKAAGGPEAVAKQHSLGKLTARERIDALMDPGTFVEVNTFIQHQIMDLAIGRNRPFGDAVITGHGLINGRPAYVFSQDFTVLGGSVGRMTAQKICEIMKRAGDAGVPIIGINDSVGARLWDLPGGYGYVWHQNAILSGVVPQISLIMGSCVGGAVYGPTLTDFIIMVDKVGEMYITGPRVIKEVMMEDVTAQELGGAKIHNEVSGVSDFLTQNDHECLELTKKLLGFLPLNWREQPPRVDTGDDPRRAVDELLKLVPGEPEKAYDMRSFIKVIADNGDFLEVKARWARNIVVGFARLGGNSVGIIANNPSFLAGCLDCDASDKAARFIRFCDCFNIPVVTFADCPGYLPGTKEEKKGIIRHGAKMLYAYSEATVPKITCIVRKLAGGSQTGMCGKTAAPDYVFAWPIAEFGGMKPEAVVDVIYRKEIESAEDPARVRAEKVAEYRALRTGPYYVASYGNIDEIIWPQETRSRIISALEIMRNKKEYRPERKHGNIPL